MEKYINTLFKEANRAFQQKEVPIGAIVVYQNKVIAKAHNRRIKSHDVTSHAEIIAIRRAAQSINNYRLVETSLYVTLEPCVMCFGAILHSRIQRLIFGAKDLKFGAVGSVVNLSNYKWTHQFSYQGGVLEKDCADILQKFFKTKR